MVSNEDALRIVGDDIAAGLSDLLTPNGGGGGDDAGGGVGGFRIHDGFGRILERPITDGVGGDAEGDPTYRVIPWQWTGVHVAELLGIPPRPDGPREITVAGVTILEDQGEGVVLHRFVDWATVLQELGVRPYARPIVDVRERYGESFVESYAQPPVDGGSM